MSLPAEIWYRIVRLATEIPAALDTTYQSPIDRPWPLSDYHRTVSFKHIHSSAFETKRRVVAISRIWNVLATRFLYETIFIKGDKDVILLARTLNDHPEYSRYITRLEFPSTNMSNSSEVRASLRYILSRTNNLTVLSAANHTWTLGIEWPSDLHGDCWWPALRCLTWGTMTILSPDTPWVLRMAPNLEVLTLQHSGFGFADPYRPVDLPKLHTLIFRDSSYPVPLGFRTPKLTHLWTQRPTPQLNYPSLRALTVSASGREWEVTHLNLACEELLLERTTFPFQGPNALRRIGIAFETLAMLRKQMHSLVSSVVSYTSLETIRLHPAAVRGAPPAIVWSEVHRSRRNWVFFLYWMNVWEGRHVRVEDENGLSLSAWVHPSSLSPPATDAEYREFWEPRTVVPGIGFLGLL